MSDYVKTDDLVKAIEMIVERLNPFLEWINKQAQIQSSQLKPAQQPQPAPVTLVEAVEQYVEWIKSGSAVVSGLNLVMIQKQMMDSLAAEKKRNELVETFIDYAKTYRSSLPVQVANALQDIDAFDKERGA